jgi:hypothetical protein
LYVVPRPAIIVLYSLLTLLRISERKAACGKLLQDLTRTLCSVEIQRLSNGDALFTATTCLYTLSDAMLIFFFRFPPHQLLELHIRSWLNRFSIMVGSIRPTQPKNQMPSFTTCLPPSPRERVPPETYPFTGFPSQPHILAQHLLQHTTTFVDDRREGVPLHALCCVVAGEELPRQATTRAPLGLAARSPLRPEELRHRAWG